MTGLRRMRTALETLREREVSHGADVGSDARLDEDLQSMASSKSNTLLPCRSPFRPLLLRPRPRGTESERQFHLQGGEER